MNISIYIRVSYYWFNYTEKQWLWQNRMALQEIKLLQKQRERKFGIPANPSLPTQIGTGGSLAAKTADKNDGDGGDKDELVLQDTFAQETAVMVEDPNMYDHFFLFSCISFIFCLRLNSDRPYICLNVLWSSGILRIQVLPWVLVDVLEGYTAFICFVYIVISEAPRILVESTDLYFSSYGS